MTHDVPLSAFGVAHHNHWNANDSYKYKMNANTNAIVEITTAKQIWREIEGEGWQPAQILKWMFHQERDRGRAQHSTCIYPKFRFTWVDSCICRPYTAINAIQWCTFFAAAECRSLISGHTMDILLYRSLWKNANDWIVDTFHGIELNSISKWGRHNGHWNTTELTSAKYGYFFPWSLKWLPIWVSVAIQFEKPTFNANHMNQWMTKASFWCGTMPRFELVTNFRLPTNRTVSGGVMPISIIWKLRYLGRTGALTMEYINWIHFTDRPRSISFQNGIFHVFRFCLLFFDCIDAFNCKFNLVCMADRQLILDFFFIGICATWAQWMGKSTRREKNSVEDVDTKDIHNFLLFHAPTN